MNKKGFTLIELLVVVLIIGILAAIALPQYMKAVEKSRATEAITMIGNILNAEKIYEMATGTYTNDLSSLDITMPNITTSGGASAVSTTNNFQVTVTTGANGAAPLTVVARRVKADGTSFAADADQAYNIGATIIAGGTETRYCAAQTSGKTKPEAMCKSISNGASKNNSNQFILK